jgi:hypothetical protein
VALFNQLRLRSQIANLRRENRLLQTELDRLRNFAIEEDNYATGGEVSA